MSVPRVDPREAHRLLTEEGYRYLDVRAAEEFAQGHPQGAYNIPLMHLGASGLEENPRFADQVRRVFAPDAKLVLGCAAGARSLEAAERLKALGYQHVVDQRAGFDGVKGPFGELVEPGWRAAGLPVALDPEPGRSYGELSSS